MSQSARREAIVRGLLSAAGPAPVPGDLVARATERGTAVLRRRRALRRTGWALLVLAVFAFGLWAAAEHPWEALPARSTPSWEGW
ncbi:hypothetical protein ACFVIM_09900 [Streptomyces sp. NPDC057638]|uniref:hypothetical protein n=1 Tax=Streptomyces sp. NPDC057638 TaxID=3346190 RepID=UPI0036CA9EE4